MRKSLSSENMFEVESIGDHIVHIKMDHKNDLAAAMARFQEFYESPFDDIRNKYFTLGYLKSRGGRSKPRINLYCGNDLMAAEWDGYNFPGSVLEPFIKGLFDPLTKEEAAVVEMLKYRTDDFYVIATYGDDKEVDTLEHELRHAMYGVSQEYREEVNNALKLYKRELNALKKCLKSWGYHDNVLSDECHAYMGADHDYFFNNFTDEVKEFKLKPVPKLRNKLNRIAKKYKKILKITEGK